MTRIDLPPTWAPIPHDLIVDPGVGDSAVRLYALFHKLGWERREIASIADLRSLWPTPPGESPPNERSLYRWLAQLENAGWLTYTRKRGQKGLGDRLQLYPEPVGKPLTPESEGEKVLTLVSEVAVSSDSGVRGLGEVLTLVSEGSDSGVRTSTKIPHQDAEKNATQIRTQTPESDPPPPPAPSTPDAASPGGGGSAAPLATPEHPPQPPANPQTINLLKAAGVGAPSVRRSLAHIDPGVVERTVRACKKIPNVRDLGGLVVEALREYLATGEELAPARPAPAQPPPLPDRPPPISPDEIRAIIAARRQELRL